MIKVIGMSGAITLSYRAVFEINSKNDLFFKKYPYEGPKCLCHSNVIIHYFQPL